LGEREIKKKNSAIARTNRESNQGIADGLSSPLNASLLSHKEREGGKKKKSKKGDGPRSRGRQRCFLSRDLFLREGKREKGGLFPDRSNVGVLKKLILVCGRAFADIGGGEAAGRGGRKKKEKEKKEGAAVAVLLLEGSPHCAVCGFHRSSAREGGKNGSR